MHKWWQIVWEAWQGFSSSRGFDAAAIISYYTLFSVFPLILGLVALSGVFLEQGIVRDRIIEAVSQYAPGSTDLIRRNIEDVVTSRGSAGAVSVAGLLWAATAIFSAIRRGMNQAFEVEQERPLLRQKALELSMVLGVGVLFLGSVVVTAAVGLLRSVLPSSLSMLERPGTVVAALLLPLILSTLSFLALYRLMPNTRVSLGEVWPGALLAAVLFEVAKLAFAWYLANFATYSQVYGALGAVVAFLVWSYYSASILLLGAYVAAGYRRFLEYQRQLRLAQELEERSLPHQPTS